MVAPCWARWMPCFWHPPITHATQRDLERSACHLVGPGKGGEVWQGTEPWGLVYFQGDSGKNQSPGAGGTCF